MTTPAIASTRISAPPPDLDESAARLLAKLPRGANGPLNLMAALIHHPELLRAWGRFTGRLFESSLPARTRELLILRTACNVQSSYEWGNHVELGLQAGITVEEITRLAHPAPARGWSAEDALLLKIADELHAHGEISEETWTSATARHSIADLIEIVFIVGVYHVVRSLVGSLGVVDEPRKPELGRVVAPTT